MLLHRRGNLGRTPSAPSVPDPMIHLKKFQAVGVLSETYEVAGSRQPAQQHYTLLLRIAVGIAEAVGDAAYGA